MKDTIGSKSVLYIWLPLTEPSLKTNDIEQNKSLPNNTNWKNETIDHIFMK